MSTPWDVLIAGAGPAGSTAATLLARAGLRVLVLERERFPRFHVGESLLPFGVEVIERLGLKPTPETFVFKGGAEFVCLSTLRRSTFDFADALPGPPRHAWHVERARFDAELRDLARAAGASVRHGAAVEGIESDEQAIRVRCTTGSEQARFFLDATGQGRLLARARRSVEPFRGFGRGAVFAHYDSVGADTFAELGEARHIRILVVARGWGWVIPLPGGRLSIGRVLQEGALRESDLDAMVHGSELLRRWTAGARRGPTHLVGSFSFRNTQPRGPRFAAIGDASCFLDPVFSSGVGLAMRHAAATADALAPALLAGQEANPTLLDAVNADMQVGYDVLAALIDRFYNSRFVDNILLGPESRHELRRSVISVLAGDVFRPGNPFREMLLRSRRPRHPPSDHPPGSVRA